MWYYINIHKHARAPNGARHWESRRLCLRWVPLSSATTRRQINQPLRCACKSNSLLHIDIKGSADFPERSWEVQNLSLRRQTWYKAPACQFTCHCFTECCIFLAHLKLMGILSKVSLLNSRKWKLLMCVWRTPTLQVRFVAIKLLCLFAGTGWPPAKPQNDKFALALLLAQFNGVHS